MPQCHLDIRQAILSSQQLLCWLMIPTTHADYNFTILHLPQTSVPCISLDIAGVTFKEIEYLYINHELFLCDFEKVDLIFVLVSY